MNFNKAFEWWLKQGNNKDYEVIKTGHVSAGKWGFIEIWWQHRGLAGRDRVYRRSKGYELVEIFA